MVKHLVCIVVALSAAACDDAVVRQATPAGPTEPTARTVSYSVRVVSGADGSPVRGATVVVEGHTLESGDDGRVAVALPFGAWAVDVTAAGFLPRRTTTAANQIIALWPIASEAEAEAVRQMVYARGGPANGVLYPAEPSEPFYVTFDRQRVDPEVAEAWSLEAQAFGSMFGLRYELTQTFQYSANEVAVSFGQRDGHTCSPRPAWGFCRDPNLSYKIFTVLPEKAVDRATIRRVLASWFFGPSPLPGLMNAEAPADALSPLEIQTIRMMLQRSKKNRWPDDDRF